MVDFLGKQNLSNDLLGTIPDQFWVTSSCMTEWVAGSRTHEDIMDELEEGLGIHGEIWIHFSRTNFTI